MAQAHLKHEFPGFGLPHATTYKDRLLMPLFPHALSGWASNGVTLREKRMLDFINQITDKSDWENKVFNHDIVSKWKEEGERFWNEGRATPDEDPVYLSNQMFDFVWIYVFALLWDQS